MWPRPAHPIGDTAVTHHTGKRGVVSRRSSWRFRCNDVSWGTTRENRKAFHHRQIVPRLRDPINKTALVYRSRPNTYVDLLINKSIYAYVSANTINTWTGPKIDIITFLLITSIIMTIPRCRHLFKHGNDNFFRIFSFQNLVSLGARPTLGLHVLVQRWLCSTNNVGERCTVYRSVLVWLKT